MAPAIGDLLAVSGRGFHPAVRHESILEGIASFMIFGRIRVFELALQPASLKYQEDLRWIQKG